MSKIARKRKAPVVGEKLVNGPMFLRMKRVSSAEFQLEPDNGQLDAIVTNYNLAKDAFSKINSTDKELELCLHLLRQGAPGRLILDLFAERPWIGGGIITKV